MGAQSAPIAGIADIARDRRESEKRESKVIERGHRNGDPTAAKVPEARYAYYRRCQVFRKSGEQCKAPAEKGAHICYAHAGQLATAVRRERERRAMLAEAVAQMRKRGRTEFEAKDLFMDFKGIQVTLAAMAQALIDGRIDCKTAGRLAVELQMASKLLWMIHRKGRKGNQISPQISADERRFSKREELPELPFVLPKLQEKKVGKSWAANHLSANQGEETRIVLTAEVRAFPKSYGWPHGPPESARAA